MKQWTILRPMNLERSHCGASMMNGKLFVFGGGGVNFKSLQAVEVYDLSEDRWTESTPMPTLRSGLVSVALNNQIYVIGGGFKNPDGTFNFLTVVEIFNPEKQSWQKGPPLNMKHDAPSATLCQNTIYLFGGHHPEATGGPLTDPAFSFSEKFSLKKNAWEEIPPLPTPRFSSGAVAIKDQVWVMGGGAFRDNRFQNFDLIEIYDTEQNRWVKESSFKLPWPSAGISACTWRNKVYVFGGNDGTRITNRAAAYDPSTDKWEGLEPMPYPRAAASVAISDEAIYLVGGRDTSGKAPTNTLLAYHPV